MSNSGSVAEKLEPTIVIPRLVRTRVFASVPLKKLVLCFGDILLVNGALFLALILRDSWLPADYAAAKHFTIASSFIGFNVLHAMWLFVLYGVGLYDIERFTSRRDLIKKIVLALAICGTIGGGLFYTVNYFQITPKFFRMPPRIVLALDLTILALFLYASRQFFLRLGRNRNKIRVMLCGNGSETSQLTQILDQKGHLGYQVCDFVPFENSAENDFLAVQDFIQRRLLANQIDVIAVTRPLSDHGSMPGFFYKLLCSGIHVVDFTHLYEEVTGKIPSSLINEGWFVGSVRAFNKRGFEIAKRLLDLSVALMLGVPTLLVVPFVAITIKLDSSGPILFRQKRTGWHGHAFDVVKFRTMVSDAEIGGVQWATEGDSRITRVGKFLRRTRIDELPQLWNVLKGEMSLVGPRPERPEFVKELTDRIPFFSARNLVRPGLTGWAQINFGYGASTEDALEKLQYDLYYIKHRSVTLELSILLKTVSTILRYEGR